MPDDARDTTGQAPEALVDMQAAPDDRQIALDKVGVSGLKTPIVVLDRESERQNTVAEVTMSVNLPHHFKGTHMSRFIEALEDARGEMTMRTLPALCDDLRERLEADAAHVEARFPYFMNKAAPESGATALMDVACAFLGDVTEDRRSFTLEVQVPVTSLCPCSKAISDYGAHNQRGTITLAVRTRPDGKGAFELMWIEELVAIAEASASAPVYPLLKRADERHVTMQAYDNPVFVEDMVRNAARQLMDDDRVVWCRVRAENEESIHNHAAVAEVTWSRPVEDA
jgi:GTP cyclohydrolase I